MTTDENDEGWIIDETGNKRRVVRGRSIRFGEKFASDGYTSPHADDEEFMLPAWSAGGVPFRTSTGTTSAGSWVAPTTTVSLPSVPMMKPVKVPRLLPIPSKAPRKIVIAFLDDDGEVEWCGMVHPDTVDVNMDIAGPPEMQIAFKLIDANDESSK